MRKETWKLWFPLEVTKGHGKIYVCYSSRLLRFLVGRVPRTCFPCGKHIAILDVVIDWLIVRTEWTISTRLKDSIKGPRKSMGWRAFHNVKQDRVFAWLLEFTSITKLAMVIVVQNTFIWYWSLFYREGKLKPNNPFIVCPYDERG